MGYPQTISFASLPVIGADVDIRRGTKPGVIRLRIPHDQNIAVSSGDIILSSDGTVTLKGCVPDLSTLRVENRPRDRREYSILVYDRRATWEGTWFCSKFNIRRRDNSLEPGTEKTAAEIADVVLERIGESVDGVESDAPESHPLAEWDSVPATEALDSLSKDFPVHVVRMADDTFKVTQTGQGDSLPTNLPAKHPDFIAAIDSGPKYIQVECGKTWYYCGIELEAVGLEPDGSYVPIEQLSYKPATGWAAEWPTLFSGVEPVYRPLALGSIYRVYRVVVPQTFPQDMTLTERLNIDLDTHGCVFGQSFQPVAQVDGTYYAHTDHYENVAGCPFNTTNFVIDNELKAVKFDYPVFKAGSCVLPADLKLWTAFHYRRHGEKELEWVRERFTVERETGYGARIYRIDWLWRAHAFYKLNCAHGAEHDNFDSLKVEADVITGAWKDHWNAVVNKRQLNAAGVWPVNLSGNIAHVTMKVGAGKAPVTRASEHTEHLAR